MKHLFLNRHAKSDWGDSQMNDFDRPLNKRGMHDAPMMGKRLAERDHEIDLIISSPAKRAITTAKLMAQELGYAVDDIQEEPKIYEAHVRELLIIVNGLDNGYNSVIMYGHNPGFTDLADYLTGAGILNLPTCGICKITFDFDDWAEVSAHTGKMEYMDFPKREVVK
ncbi:SixA phosphatase family protein [Cryomorpha ignava]|nr:histidine phosphatase family protein [Cryomorpha ignava]